MSSNILSYLAVVLVLCASAQAQCQQKYQFNGEKCLKGVNTNLSWMKAQQYCGKDGGYLANILNQKDQSVTHALTKDLGCDVWIGALVYKSNTYFFNQAPPPKFDPDTWFYPTPNLNAYTNWEIGRPDNYKISQPCVYQYSSNGTWNDKECDYKYCFICETDVL